MLNLDLTMCCVKFMPNKKKKKNSRPNLFDKMQGCNTKNAMIESESALRCNKHQHVGDATQHTRHSVILWTHLNSVRQATSMCFFLPTTAVAVVVRTE